MQFKNIILSFIASAVVINAGVIPNPPGAPEAPAAPALPALPATDVPNTQTLPELPNYEDCVNKAKALLGEGTPTIDNAAKSASLCNVCITWVRGLCLVYGPVTTGSVTFAQQSCYTNSLSYCFSFNGVGPSVPKPETLDDLPAPPTVPTDPTPAVPAPPVAPVV